MANERFGQLVPRDVAVQLGLKRYFSGESCAKGHVAERYTRDNVCVECAKEKLRNRYAKDPEKWKAHSIQSRDGSPEALAHRAAMTRHRRKTDPDRYRSYDKNKYTKIRQDPLKLEAERARQRDKQARAYRKDPEKFRVRASRLRSDPEIRQRLNEQCRNYKKQNPEVVAELNRKHNPIRRAAVFRRTPPWLTDEDKRAMYEIYKDAHSRGLHVDHIVPLRGKLVSGLHVPWNLQALDPIENSRKRNHFEVDT